MHETLREALDQVRAEEALKQRTKAYLFRQTDGYARRPPRRRRLLPAAACLALLLLGGRWLYFTPTLAVSIDINPSVELGINRFDRVISVTGWNEDGQALAEQLAVRNMRCTEAVRTILENDLVAELLAPDGIMAIGVVGEDGEQARQILSDLEDCTAEGGHTYCYYACWEEAETAHQLGLSCGRYRALLEAQALDPEITPEEIRGMTMREIRDLIEGLSPDSAGTDDGDAGHGHGHRGGSGHGA